MLKAYGLCAPSDEVLIDKEVLGVHDRFAIALPLAVSGSATWYPQAVADVVWAGVTPHPDSTVYDLSPEALVVPSNTKVRFRRLIDVWRLKVDDPTNGNLIAPVESTPDVISEGKATSVEKNMERLDPDFGQPRWMLWSFVDTRGYL